LLQVQKCLRGSQAWYYRVYKTAALKENTMVLPVTPSAGYENSADEADQGPDRVCTLPEGRRVIKKNNPGKTGY